MKFKKTLSYLTILALIVNILFIKGFIVHAAGTASITYTLSSRNIKVGDNFDITVNCSNASDLYGASIDFKYDTTLMQITSVDQGTIFTGSGKVVQVPVNTIANGLINFAEMFSGDTAGVNTSGSMFIIHSKALKSGDLALNTISDSSNLSATGNNIGIKLSGGANASAIPYNATVENIDIDNIATPVGTGKYEESNAALIFTGAWTKYTDINCSGGAEKYSTTKGSHVDLTFTGSDIKWISDSNAYSGIANVIIDGTLIATIDNYNTTSSSNKIVYQNNTLTNTTHTIRIESTGTKNLKSKGYTMSIDALEVAIVPVGIGKYEETNSALTFAGTWAKYTDISCSAGAEKYSTAKGAYVDLIFTGSAIKWISDSNAYSGISKVSIDGTLVATIDNFSTTSSSNKVVYQNYSLTNTVHTIRIECTGLKNASSKGYTSSIDALEVTTAPLGIGKYEETNSALAFTGTWSKYTDINCSGGAEKYSTTKGSYTDFTFTGSAIKWISDSNAYSGISKVSIDGTLVATVDNYSATPSSNKVVYQNYSLTNTVHTIRIECTGLKNNSSKGYTSSIDALEVITAPLGIGKYEETNSALAFTGSWAKYSDINCSGGSEKYLATKGSYIDFTFIGSAIKWLSDSNTYSGISKVSIDGTLVATIDNFSTTSSSNKVVYQNYSLTNTVHTIRIECTGLKNPNSKGYTSSIDALEVTSVTLGIGKYEETNPALAFTGTWAKYTDINCSSGAEKYSTTKGSYIDFTFTGSAIKWISDSNTYSGISKVSIDGNLVATIDNFSATSSLNKIVYQNYALSDSVHTIRIECTGLKNPNSKGYSTSIDAIEVTK